MSDTLYTLVSGVTGFQQVEDTPVHVNTNALLLSGHLGTSTNVTINGNITVTGNVDGRDVAADGIKADNNFTTLNTSSARWNTNANTELAANSADWNYTAANSAAHANESSYKFITLSGNGAEVEFQADVVADSATDTLTLCAGPNILLLSDATNDVITISGSGGGSSFNSSELAAASARYTRTALSLETNVVPSTADWNYTAANTAISVAFDVTNSSSGAYRFNNGGFTNDDNPTLHLQRGKTYRFRVNASGHPFLIKTQAGTGTSNQYLSGVSGAGAQTGNVDFEVRHDAPRILYYQCQNHSAMVGAMHIGDATATTEVFNNSANWNQAYITSNNNFSTLNSNSARYNRTALSLETNVVPATGSWNSTNTTLVASSARYTQTALSVETFAAGPSGTWVAAHTYVHANSAQLDHVRNGFVTNIVPATAGWNSNYNTVNSNSADWNYTAANSAAHANESSYKTVALSGNRLKAAIGADVVADSTTDTLTLCAGPNIVLLSDPTNDVITISGSAGGGGSGVTAVSGGIALVGTTAHLADPETLTQIAEADAVGADRMLIWDESVSSWKYITIEDLQDEIDTGGGSGEANENSYKTVALSGNRLKAAIGADIVADSKTDTLTLCAGPNIVLLSDPTNDVITISGSAGGGGGSSFNSSEIAAASARYTRTALSVETNVVPATGSWNSTNTTLVANSARYTQTALSLETNVKSNSADWNYTAANSAAHANESSFKTVTLSGNRLKAAIGADIVADSTTDTLTLCAGPNIVLLSDPTNDVITISGSAGGGGSGGSSFNSSEIAANSADWNYTAANSGGENQSTITTETEDIFSSFSTDAAYSKVRTLLHMEKLDPTTTLPISSVEIHDDSYKPATYYRANGAALSTAQKKFGSSSLLLDGSNDYVYRQNVSNDDLFLGSQNWCWECWFYPTAIGRAQSLVNQSNGSAASNSSAILYIDSSNNAAIYTTENTGWDNYALSTSGEISAANQWYHIAGVRYNDHSGSDTLKIYVNGNSYASVDMTGKSIPASTRNLEIGIQAAGENDHGPVAGYIDDVRVTIGDPVYTANFTPPAVAHSGESRFQQTVVTGLTGNPVELAISTETQAVKTFHSTDDEYHNVQLLLHCEGTNNDTDMDDDSRVGHHFDFIGNSKLSSAQKKFGSTSLFTGTSDNDHILVDSDDTNFLELGTEDFTLEFWLYWNGVTGYQTVFDNGYGSGSTAGSWMIQTDNGNGRMKWYQNGGVLVTEGSDPANTTWLHYAIVRSSGTLKIYRNGIQTASGSTTNAYYTPDKLSIGARNAGTYAFDGYLDDIRITKGVARYSGSDTSSANFTVPSAAFSGEALESTTVITGISGSVADAVKIDSNYSTTNANSADWNYTAANSAAHANESSFKTVALSGNRLKAAIGADVVADTATDTITLCAGPNIVLLSDPTNDVITISGSAGGGGSSGISFDGSTANGVLTYKDSDEATVESNITFDGSKLAITGNIHTSVHDYGTGADLNIDFDQDALQKYVLNAGLSADTAAANKGAGKSVVVLLSAGSASRNFNWNSSWKFIGEKPASIAGNKVAILSMTCFGAAETDIICSYGVQD